MTFPELQIQLDLNPDNRVNILDNTDTCRLTKYGYFFIDQENGQCYLFDMNGNPDDINKVEIIKPWAFANCASLANVKIPNFIKVVEDAAFYNCKSLTNIKIPNSIEYIGNWAFWKCKSLTSIKIPNSVENIREWAFYNCILLKEVIFERKTMEQVKAMDDYPWGIKDESIIKCLG